MGINDWEITPLKLNINQTYVGKSTLCRYRKNDMSFTIEKKYPYSDLTLEYEVIFESIHNSDMVAEASFEIKTTFKTSNNADADLTPIERFLNEVSLKITAYLKDVNNIPSGMISAPTGILSAYDISMLRDDFSGELIKQGFY